MSKETAAPPRPPDDKQQQVNDVTEKTQAAIAAEVAPPSSNKADKKNLLDRVFKRRRPRSSRGNCRMFFPSSGRMGFDQVKTSDELPPVEILRDMIRYETRLRLSEPIQDLMDVYCADEESVT